MQRYAIGDNVRTLKGNATVRGWVTPVFKTAKSHSWYVIELEDGTYSRPDMLSKHDCDRHPSGSPNPTRPLPKSSFLSLESAMQESGYEGRVKADLKKGLIVPLSFRKEYEQRPKSDGVSPSELLRKDSPIRTSTKSKNPLDIKPSPQEIAYMLEVKQGGQDAFGVVAGSYHKTDGTYKRTRFDASHIKSIAEFNDGREHWWNKDGSPNWRVLAEFNNAFESSFPNAADRDKATKDRLEESGIQHSISETVVRNLVSDPSTIILELKVKVASA